MMLVLKKYLQLHENEFESFELLEPALEIWHTESTNLSRLFETHWGMPLSKNPSTLGHSARKIGRMTPASFKTYIPICVMLKFVPNCLPSCAASVSGRHRPQIPRTGGTSSTYWLLYIAHTAQCRQSLDRNYIYISTRHWIIRNICRSRVISTNG